jgi:hypothetical protein
VNYEEPKVKLILGEKEEQISADEQKAIQELLRKMRSDKFKEQVFGDVEIEQVPKPDVEVESSPTDITELINIIEEPVEDPITKQIPKEIVEIWKKKGKKHQKKYSLRWIYEARRALKPKNSFLHIVETKDVTPEEWEAEGVEPYMVQDMETVSSEALAIAVKSRVEGIGVAAARAAVLEDMDARVFEEEMRNAEESKKERRKRGSGSPLMKQFEEHIKGIDFAVHE